MKAYSCACLTILLLSCSLYAQKPESLLNHYRSEWNQLSRGEEEAPRIDTLFDVGFYHLDVEINVNTPYIQGNVSYKVNVGVSELEEIWLDLHHALNIDSIAGDCSGFQIDKYRDKVRIQLDREYTRGETVEFQVFYRGAPEMPGGYKGLRYELHAENEPVIASLSTPFLAHYWWPCKDGPQDKADSVFIDITIPDTTINGVKLMAVSNGTLEKIIRKKGKKTFLWRHRYPITPYYVMMAISNYKHFKQNFTGSNGENFPIDYYVFQDHLDEAEKGVEDMPEVMKCFSDLFGPYPFRTEKYGMTQLGFYSGIENQTNTVINKMSEDWFDVSVHELAHAWFGEMITCKNWHHAWLNEGFATYAEALWKEYKDGDEAYHKDMVHNEYYRGGTLYLPDDTDPFRIFTSIIYQKGAYTLHMLRKVVGDEQFFKILKTYAQSHKFMYGHATTEDFQRICEDVSGQELDYFFEQWVYDEYYPIYRYGYHQFESNKALLVIYQIQGKKGRRPIFKMPVDFLFTFEDGSDTLINVWTNRQSVHKMIPLGKKIKSITLDPDFWVLKQSERVGLDEYTIRNAQFKESVSLYNSPSTQELILEIGGPTYPPTEIQLINLEGKAIFQNKLQYQSGTYYQRFDLRNYRKGIYFLRIRSKVGQIVKKILIE